MRHHSRLERSWESGSGAGSCTTACQSPARAGDTGHFASAPTHPSGQPVTQHCVAVARAVQETEVINYNPIRGGIMEHLKGLASFVSALRAERTNLVDRLRHVDAALSVLGKLDGGSSPRTLSAAGRRRIGLAQKARWKKANGRAPKPKRTISAAGRKRIAAAQRARWAKVKAEQKKGK